MSSLTTLHNLPLKVYSRKGGSQIYRQSIPITSVQVFLGRPQPRPPVGLSFWTLFSQPSLCSTCPCHLSWRVRSIIAKSSSCYLSRSSYELTWTLVVTQHIPQTVLQAMQIKLCRGPGVAYIAHGLPGARTINSSSGGDGKSAGD